MGTASADIYSFEALDLNQKERIIFYCSLDSENVLSSNRWGISTLKVTPHSPETFWSRINVFSWNIVGILLSGAWMLTWVRAFYFCIPIHLFSLAKGVIKTFVCWVYMYMIYMYVHIHMYVHMCVYMDISISRSLHFIISVFHNSKWIIKSGHFKQKEFYCISQDDDFIILSASNYSVIYETIQ